MSGEALPAVTVPSFANAGFSVASFSTRGVGPDALVALELDAGHGDDPVVVAAVVPRGGGEPVAAHGERVLRLARDPWIVASFSALSPSEIVHCSGIAGLTIRQPSVVECSSWLVRAKPRSGLSSTHGARLIDSTPPTSTSDASPVSTAREA